MITRVPAMLKIAITVTGLSSPEDENTIFSYANDVLKQRLHELGTYPRNIKVNHLASSVTLMFTATESTGGKNNRAVLQQEYENIKKLIRSTSRYSLNMTATREVYKKTCTEKVVKSLIFSE